MFPLTGKDSYTWFEELDNNVTLLNEITESLRLFNLSKNPAYRKEFWGFKKTGKNLQ